MVLAVVVVGAPLVLSGPGPGTETVVGHVVAGLAAIGATGLAAHRRTPPAVALGAAVAVPVLVLVVLGTLWWA